MIDMQIDKQREKGGGGKEAVITEEIDRKRERER